MRIPFLVILDGPMGAGKTTVSRALGNKLRSTVIISWDDIKETIPNFTYAKNGKNYKKILSVRKILVQRGVAKRQNIIMDAGFSSGKRMKPFIRLAKQKNYRLFIYQFTAPHAVLLKRALGRPKLRWEKKRISRANIIQHLHFYRDNKYIGRVTELFDTEQLTPRSITKRILQDVE